MTDLVKVTQADSSAAKECWNALADADNDWDALSVDEQLALIEAFARHAANTRISVLEEAAGLAEMGDWDSWSALATAIRSLSQPEGNAGASVGPGYSAEPEPEVSALSGEYPSRGADRELIYQALRFYFWAAGQGISPDRAEPASEPEEGFWQYTHRTGDENWETVADRYLATAIEARSGETADAGSTEGKSATGNAGDAHKGGLDGE